MSNRLFDDAVINCCNAGLTITQTARKLGCGHHRIARVRNRLGLVFSTTPRLGLVFSTTPGIDRGASLATGDRAVVEIDGRRISLALTPFDTTPDARVETAPRRRGLIGGSVTREELVLDGPADRVIGELRGAVVRGRVV